MIKLENQPTIKFILRKFNKENRKTYIHLRLAKSSVALSEGMALALETY